MFDFDFVDYAHAGLPSALTGMLEVELSKDGVIGCRFMPMIVGEEDVLTPVADSELLHQSIERSQLVVLDTAGHLSCLETPDEFSIALSNFLASNL